MEAVGILKLLSLLTFEGMGTNLEQIKTRWTKMILLVQGGQVLQDWFNESSLDYITDRLYCHLSLRAENATS